MYIMLYLHTLDSSAIARKGGEVIAKPFSDWEGCNGFQPIEGSHHASLANRGGCDRNVRNHRRSHFLCCLVTLWGEKPRQLFVVLFIVTYLPHLN